MFLRRIIFLLGVGLCSNLYSSMPDVKTGAERGLIPTVSEPKQEDKDHSIENELGLIFPQFYTCPQLLEKFVAINKRFEGSKNFFCGCPSAYLDKPSLDGTYVFLTSHAFNQEAVEHDFAIAYRALVHRQQAMRNFLFRCSSCKSGAEHNPYAITLEYLGKKLWLDEALLYAIAGDSRIFAQTLLRLGANANAQDERGLTPLVRLSASGNNLRTNAENAPTDDLWRIAQDHAIDNNEDLRAMAIYSKEERLLIMDELFAAQALASYKSHEGYAPLHAACANVNPAMVFRLLKRCRVQDMHATTNTGETALMLVARNIQEGDPLRTKIARRLIKYAKDNKIPVLPCDRYVAKAVDKLDEVSHNLDKKLGRLAKFNVVLARHKQSNVFTALGRREIGTTKGPKFPVRPKKSVCTITVQDEPSK